MCSTPGVCSEHSCACCSLLQKEQGEVMGKHRDGIRGVLWVLRHGHLQQLSWLGVELWGWMLSSWSQGGEQLCLEPPVWNTRSLTGALQPLSSPAHLPQIFGTPGIAGRAGVPSVALEQPQGSETQLWVGAGSLLRRGRMRKLILCCIRFAELLEDFQHKMWGFCVVLGGAASYDSQMLPVVFKFKKLLVPSRYNSRHLCLPESMERRWTAKWQRMGLFLLISTELPFLPSSEKGVRAIRFSLRGKTVIWVFYNLNQ